MLIFAASYIRIAKPNLGPWSSDFVRQTTSLLIAEIKTAQPDSVINYFIDESKNDIQIRMWLSGPVLMKALLETPTFGAKMSAMNSLADSIVGQFHQKLLIRTGLYFRLIRCERRKMLSRKIFRFLEKAEFLNQLELDNKYISERIKEIRTDLIKIKSKLNANETNLVETEANLLSHQQIF